MHQTTPRPAPYTQPGHAVAYSDADAPTDVGGAPGQWPDPALLLLVAALGVLAGVVWLWTQAPPTESLRMSGLLGDALAIVSPPVVGLCALALWASRGRE